MILDVHGSTPVELARYEWATDFGPAVNVIGLALSPDGTVLAASYQRYGVRLFRVSGDTITPQGMVNTSGEARDVYVDAQGFQYVFAWDNMQVFDRDGRQVETYLPGFPMDGGWAPFEDGTVIVPASSLGLMVLDLQGGRVTVKEILRSRNMTNAWQAIYDPPYVYSAGTLLSVRGSGFQIGQVGDVLTGRGSLPITIRELNQVAEVPIPGGPIFAIAKYHSQLWCLSTVSGVLAYDVSTATVPRLIFHDPFTFRFNGPHARIVAARGRIYVCAGDASLRIYDPETLKHTGTIEGLTVDFLDTVGQDFLVVANYWFPKMPDGMYVYDLRKNPDDPTLADRFPREGRSANFRVRVFGDHIYRVALNGLDIFEAP